MKVLVTGATGFVGTHLVEQLLATGNALTALVRSPAKADGLAERGVRLVVGTLSDRAAVRQATADQDAIIHVAGAIAARSEAEFLAVNRDATKLLVDTAAEQGRPRFVLVSSLAAGGPSPPDHPLQGTEPPRPVTQYGRSKLAGEQVVRAGPLPWTIARPPAVYGPHDREMFRIFRAATLGIAPVFADGTQRLSLVYGPDLARALVACLTPGALGGIFYPAHAEQLTSRELVSIAGRAAGKTPRIFSIPLPLGRAALRLTGAWARLTGRTTVLTEDKANELFQPAWLCDPAPLTAATGWRAEVDFTRGARETLAWYRHHRWL